MTTSRSRKFAITVAAVLSILIIIVCVVCFFVIDFVGDKLDLIDYDDGNENVSSSESVSSSDIYSWLEGAQAVDNGLHDALFQGEDVVNILLLGTDERTDEYSNTARADAILLLSINKNTNIVKLVSLERQMSVVYPNGHVDLLTHAFHYGGPQWVLYCVQNHFGLDVDKYIRVNFDVFEKIVDAVGGVDIELTEKEAKAFNHEVYTNTFPIDRKLEPGWNHLNGYEAVQYCRLRYIDSDWFRIVRQRKTIAAIQERCKDMSVGELVSVLDTVLPLVKTNLTKGEIVALIQMTPKLLSSEIEDMTIPVDGTYWDLTRVNFEVNAKILHDFIYGEEENSKP